MTKVHYLLLQAGAALMVMAYLATPVLTRASAAGDSSLAFTPDADSYATSSQPDANYGTRTTVRVDGSPDVYTFMRFTVSGMNGAPISQAILQIYANSASRLGLKANAVQDNSWSEMGINYGNMPQMGGGIAISPAVFTGTWVSLDVTSYVTGDGTYSFGILTPGWTAISLASRESGAHAPRLLLTLAPSAPPSTPTPLATDSPTATSTPSSPDEATATDTLMPTDVPAATDTPIPGGVITDTPVPSDVTPTTDLSTPTDVGTAVSTSTPIDSSTATATPTAGITPNPPPSGSIQHVFIIAMENHGYDQVWNTGSAPFLTQLGNTYARATNYFAITHPSLPNYLDLFAGLNYGITTDCNPSSSCHASAVNLADNLEAKGLTWKGYMESMPSPCYLTISGNYAPKHNPFVYFDDIRNDPARCNSHVVPFSALGGDLLSASSTPNYAFISPDQCNDMHSCSIAVGDTWLQAHVPAILGSPACTVDKCLLVITFDEDDDNSGNHVLTVFAGSGAQTGVSSSTMYTHFSLLRTVEDIFGLPTQTANDGSAGSMSDMLH